MKRGTVILCMGGFLLGLLGVRMPAWMEASTDDSNKRVPARESTATSPSAGGGNGHAGPRHPRNLAGLIRLQNELKKGDPAMIREVERLDVAALKQLIAGLAAEMKPPPADTPEAFQELIRIATNQLVKLEGEEAMSWALANIATTPAWETMMTALINAAAQDSPELGKRWKEEAEARGRGSFYYYEGFARDAAHRGVEEVMKLHHLMGGLPSGLGASGFPDDFDFHRLMVGLAKEPNPFNWSYVNSLATTFIYWAAKDREAAWKGLVEVMPMNRGAEFLVAEYMQQIRETDGDHEASKFLVDHFGEIPEKARSFVLDFQCYRFPQAAVELIGMLPEVEDRKMLAASYLNPRNRPDDTLRALEALGSEQLQMEVLLPSAKRMTDSPFYHEREDARSYFARVLREASLSPENRAQIEAALRGEDGQK